MLNAGRPPEIRAARPFLSYFKMTLYIILLFIALCAGMALSVYAFGTGGKRKRIFQDIYFSVEETNGARAARIPASACSLRNRAAI